MKRKLIPYLKKTFSGINHPVMIVAVVISFGLWYLNKLGHTYTTTVMLPVSIVNSAESAVGVLQNENIIECRVEGTGYELLTYRVMPRRHTILIDLRRVDLRPVEGGNKSEVTHTSLYNAMSEQMGELRLLSILTPRVEVTTAPFHVKKVPVRSRVEVEFKNQYMQIGPTVLSPDSIEVKSLDFLLDTLQAVYTDAREYTNVSSSLAGRVGLQPIPDAVLTVNEVEFDITVELYTEVPLVLPLSVLNAPEGMTAVVLPDEVSIKLNVAQNQYAEAYSGEIRAWIDYNDRNTNVGKQFKVYVPVPEGIVVTEIRPLYVELVFEERE